MTPAQSRLHFELLGQLGIRTDADRYRTYSTIACRPITSSKDLTGVEGKAVIEELQLMVSDYSPADRALQVAIFKGEPIDPWAEVGAA